MKPTIALLVFVAGLLAQGPDWIASGNRALDQGKPDEAAADYVHALETLLRTGAPANPVFQMRITLATAYMEAGAYREMERVLEDAQNMPGARKDGQARAELLNAWSAVHLKQGRLSVAESELREARRVVRELPNPGDLLPTVSHNLAAVEMRTRQYSEALDHEREAITELEKLVPPDHPSLIHGWASLASLQFMMGEPAQAQISMDRAIASAERTYGPAHAMIADLLESDVVVLEKLKRKKDARRVRERAREIRGGRARPAGSRASWDVREALTPEGQVYLETR